MKREVDQKTDCTFTSLCGKRVRCNQTGAVMSRRAVKAFKNGYLSSLLEEYNEKNNPLRKEKEIQISSAGFQHIPVRRAKIDAYGDVDCPYCRCSNWVERPQAIVCRNVGCRRTFVAEPPTIKTSFIRNGYVRGRSCYFVHCPQDNCFATTEVTDSGIGSCASCGSKFDAKW